MHYHRLAQDYLNGLEIVGQWPDMSRLVDDYAKREPGAWTLPAAACEAVGGTVEQAVSAMAAIGSAQIGIILIDDMLDEDPRGEYRQTGHGPAANLAWAFQAAAAEAILDGTREDCDSRHGACRALNDLSSLTAYGQYLDSLNLNTEEAYWHTIRTKSAPFFGAALKIGAICGGASTQLAELIEQFGLLYGEMIQIHDDLADALAVPANPDWQLGRWPLPILYAQTVDHPDRDRFVQLRSLVSDPTLLAEAQDILIRCGAISYGLYHLMTRYGQAKRLIAEARLANPSKLEGLLDRLMQPVDSLLEKIGVESPTAVIADLAAPA